MSWALFMKVSTSKKLSLGLVSLMALVVVLWGIAPTAAVAKDSVKLGLLSPFSPPGDPAAGKRMRWGAELAIEYINNEMGGVLDGRPVELVVEDDSGTPADGIAGFRKLVQKDGAVAVVGQYHSSVCLAVNKVSRDLQVPLFSSGASSPKITESQNPYIFSIMSLTPDRAKFWVDFAKAMNFKRLAIIAEDTDYGTGFEKFVKDFGKTAGMEVKSIIFPRTITDMTPMLLETKAWKPDLIINLGVGPPAYLMVKQAYDIGLFPQVKMLGSFAWPVRPEYWDAVGEKGKYVLYTSYYKPGMLMSDSGNWMAAKYKAAHGEDPTFYALNVFGEMLVIAQALNKAQSDDPRALQKALVGNTYQDWSGDVKFEEPPGLKWHNVSPPHLILQQTEVRQAFTESKLVFPSQFGGDGKIAGP
jgi:branched-chain amino acid transport system substrate-binding protein